MVQAAVYKNSWWRITDLVLVIARIPAHKRQQNGLKPKSPTNDSRTRNSVIDIFTTAMKDCHSLGNLQIASSFSYFVETSNGAVVI